MNTKQKISHIEDLILQYDALLLDAYGVLVNGKGSLPYAKEFMNHLEETKKDYLIVTNNASSSTYAIAKSFEKNGLLIPEEKILSSGSLLSPWMRENFRNDSPRVLFMGGFESQELLQEASCYITNVKDYKENSLENYDVLVICTQEEKDFRSNFEKLMSYLFQAEERNSFPQIILPNPDLIYPKDEKNFGIVSGMIAHMLEGALRLRFPRKTFNIEALGKPGSYIFEKAKEKFPGKKLLMVGDQIETDVKGAHKVGIHSALMLGGVVCEKNLDDKGAYQPRFLLESLKLL